MDTKTRLALIGRFIESAQAELDWLLVTPATEEYINTLRADLNHAKLTALNMAVRPSITSLPERELNENPCRS